jgi:hypothetical protein
MKGKLLFYGLILGAVGGAVAATVAQWPDIQRYMKMKSM